MIKIECPKCKTTTTLEYTIQGLIGKPACGHVWKVGRRYGLFASDPALDNLAGELSTLCADLDPLDLPALR
jgi:hypothetical protein